MSNQAKTIMKKYLGEVFDNGYIIGGEVYQRKKDAALSDGDLYYIADGIFEELVEEQYRMANEERSSSRDRDILPILSPFKVGFVMGYIAAREGTFNK